MGPMSQALPQSQSQSQQQQQQQQQPYPSTRSNAGCLQASGSQAQSPPPQQPAYPPIRSNAGSGQVPGSVAQTPSVTGGRRRTQRRSSLEAPGYVRPLHEYSSRRLVAMLDTAAEGDGTEEATSLPLEMMTGHEIATAVGGLSAPLPSIRSPSAAKCGFIAERAPARAQHTDGGDTGFSDSASTSSAAFAVPVFSLAGRQGVVGSAAAAAATAAAAAGSSEADLCAMACGLGMGDALNERVGATDFYGLIMEDGDGCDGGGVGSPAAIGSRHPQQLPPIARGKPGNLLSDGRRPTAAVQEPATGSCIPGRRDSDDRGSGGGGGHGGSGGGGIGSSAASRAVSKPGMSPGGKARQSAADVDAVGVAAAAEAQASAATAAAAAAAALPVDTAVSPMGVPLSVLLALAERVPRGQMLTTAQVVEQYIVPQTAQQRCSYVKLMGSLEQPVGAPCAYVVHSWQVQFHTTVDALSRHFAHLKAAPDATFVWIDVACMNHNMPSPLCDATLPVLCGVLARVGKVLVVPDAHGQLLHQARACFEIWQAGLVDDATPHDKQHHERLVVLPAVWNWPALEFRWAMIDWETADAACAEEAAALRRAAAGACGAPGGLAALVKSALLKGTVREMYRAEAAASLGLRRFLDAAQAHAMMLYLERRYGEAEDTLRAAKASIDKAAAVRELRNDPCDLLYFLHSGYVAREKGLLHDASRIIGICVSLCGNAACGRGTLAAFAKQLQVEAQAVLVSLMCETKDFTKAEMLCRRLADEEQARCESEAGGASSPLLVRLTLQLMEISSAQHILEETEAHAETVQKLSRRLGTSAGARGSMDAGFEPSAAVALAAAAGHQLLGVVQLHARKFDAAHASLTTALEERTRVLGRCHPLTLQTRGTLVALMLALEDLDDAQATMRDLVDAHKRVHGPEHHLTLEAMGTLADFLEAKRSADARDIEAAIMQTGKAMLRRHRIDNFKALEYISQFFVTRDYLLEKAAHFLTKALMVFKERLPPDCDLIQSTKSRLLRVVEQQKGIADEALENGELHGDASQLRVAEVQYRQAWSLCKLVGGCPEDDVKELARGLADALFGQGKVQEARTLMKTAGLIKKGMASSVPPSYLRWLNQRVVKYMDGRGDDEWDDDVGAGGMA